jgi:hypothetical protein
MTLLASVYILLLLLLLFINLLLIPILLLIRCVLGLHSEADTALFRATCTAHIKHYFYCWYISEQFHVEPVLFSINITFACIFLIFTVTSQSIKVILIIIIIITIIMSQQNLHSNFNAKL